MDEKTKQLLLHPKENQYDFTKLTLYELLLDDNSDFSRLLRRRWEDIYYKSKFVVQKNESNNVIVQLIDSQDRDITIMVNISKAGNVNLTISSLAGYCCRLKVKNITKHFDVRNV